MRVGDIDRVRHDAWLRVWDHAMLGRLSLGAFQRVCIPGIGYSELCEVEIERREGRERGKAQIGCGGYKSRGDACSQPYRAKVDILLVVFDAAAPPRRARCAASLLRAVRVNHTW